MAWDVFSARAICVQVRASQYRIVESASHTFFGILHVSSTKLSDDDTMLIDRYENR